MHSDPVKVLRQIFARILFHSFTFENAVNKLERAVEATVEVILTPF